MKIAYLVNQYPGISHTFVRREIQALERQGIDVLRFAIRPSKAGLISDEYKAEDARTRHIVGTSKGAIISAILQAIIKHPLGVVSAFGAMLQLGWRSEAGLARHVLYFLEALVLGIWMRTENVSHVHAHFGTNSTTAVSYTHLTLPTIYSV